MDNIHGKIDLDKVNFDIESIMKDVKGNITSEVEIKAHDVKIEEAETENINSLDASISEVAKQIGGK